MKYQFPINPPYRITQKFAENLIDYSQFKLNGHNGIDVACPRGTPIICPFNGQVVFLKDDVPAGGKGYGNYTRILVIDNGKYYEWTFGHHLPNTGLSLGKEVYKGDVLAFVDTTGYSTGDHLHFGVRELRPRSEGVTVKYLNKTYQILNPHNDYLGSIDPMPFFEQVQDEVLPVDMRYFAPESRLRELKWKLVHEAYAKKKARKNAIPWSDRLMKAFVYGYHDAETVFDPAMIDMWRNMSKPEFNKRLGR